jgi:glutamyl-tRNA synthetase
VPQAEFFFREIASYDEKGMKKHWSKPQAKKILLDLAELLEKTEPFSEEAIEAGCNEYAQREGIKLGDLVHPARLALTGRTVSPGLFKTIELLGRQTAAVRLRKAAEKIPDVA